MNNHKQEYLWERFANILPDRATLTPENSCMYWGFAVGDGWFDLVNQTLKRAEELCMKYPDSGLGFQIVQVKEKFGRLRIYYDGWIHTKIIEWKDDPMLKIFLDAEAKSGTICEDCGKAGELQTDRFWIRTLCHQCSEKDLKRRRTNLK